MNWLHTLEALFVSFCIIVGVQMTVAQKKPQVTSASSGVVASLRSGGDSISLRRALCFRYTQPSPTTRRDTPARKPITRPAVVPALIEEDGACVACNSFVSLARSEQNGPEKPDGQSHTKSFDTSNPPCSSDSSSHWPPFSHNIGQFFSQLSPQNPGAQIHCEVTSAWSVPAKSDSQLPPFWQSESRRQISANVFGCMDSNKTHRMMKR